MNYNLVNGYGAAVLHSILSAVPTFGKIFIVCPNTDANFQKLQDIFRNDPDGDVMIFNDIATAYAATVTNRNDVVALSANAAHAVTSMLDVSKNRVHFVGINIGDRQYGSRSRITMGVTTAATDLGVMRNTGVGNSFINLKFDSGNTKAESLYSVLEGGEYAYYKNCEIYKSSDLNETGAAELVLNGDSAIFENCTVGSLANQLVGTIIRPCVLTTKGTVASGKVARDCTFRKCTFWRNASHVNNRFVYGANADDVERLIKFEECGFIANKLSLAVPAQAVASGSSLSAGYIVLDPTCYGVNVTKLSTTTGVMVTGPAPAAGQGIAVNAA